MYTKGDFHIHTIYSDGHHTPEEVVNLAKSNGVDILSITDHNSTSGIDEAIIAGKNCGVMIIPGVELSTRYNSTRVHILGYFSDDSYKNELLQQILIYVRQKQINKIKKIYKGCSKFKWIGKKLPVEIGIEILKFFGALVVLAHPILLPNDDFNKIIKMNFDGIEAKYFLNNEEDTQKYIKVAKDKGIIYTAGSDFHGLKEIYRVHGMIGSPYLTEKEINKFIIELFNKEK